MVGQVLGLVSLILQKNKILKYMHKSMPYREFEGKYIYIKIIMRHFQTHSTDETAVMYN